MNTEGPRKREGEVMGEVEVETSIERFRFRLTSMGRFLGPSVHVLSLRTYRLFPFLAGSDDIPLVCV